MPNLLADWVFTKENVLEGDICGSHMVLGDATGNQNHLQLQVWGDPALPALKNALAWQDQGLRFGSRKGEGAGKYFATCKDAPINALRFEDGYTIEVELTLPGAQPFDPWMGIIARRGSGKQAGKTQGEPEILATLCFHDCFQWTWYPLDQPVNHTCWSLSWDSLPPDADVHLAIRNDGQKTRLFVNGVSDIRNPDLPLRGIEPAAGEGWVIGAALWDNQVDAFFTGVIKRIRIWDGDTGMAALQTQARPLFALQGSSQPRPLKQGKGNSLLAVVPDTQYMGQYKPQMVEAMLSWAAQQRATLDIGALVHVGDVSESSSQEEMQFANAAFYHADVAGLPYLVTPGNHDYRDGGDNFARTFGGRRYQGKPETEFCQDTLSGCMRVTLSGRKYLIVSINSYCMTDSIAWAKRRICHCKLPTIVFTHDVYLYDREAGGIARSENGNLLWRQLIGEQDEIFMVIGGHHFGVGHGVSQNAYGHPVLELLTNYQAYPNGGNGWLQLLEFDEQANQVRVCTYSPWVQSQTQRDVYDHVFLTSPQDAFSFPLCFEKRFYPLGMLGGD